MPTNVTTTVARARPIGRVLSQPQFGNGTYRSRMLLGSIALACWLVFFSAGILLESIEERVYLAPHAFPKHALADHSDGIVAAAYSGSSLYAFAKGAVVFTPINLAFLALLAGLLGGCASNLLVQDEANNRLPNRLDLNSLRYLRESPWSAMVRSFIVYLCVIAGLYVAMDDPFRDSSPAQYVRLAGAISVLALIVGYDPSRIGDWIRLAQGSLPQKVTVDHEPTATGGSHVEMKIESPQSSEVGVSTSFEEPPPSDREFESENTVAAGSPPIKG